jgi:hypothetical protein
MRAIMVECFKRLEPINNMVIGLSEVTVS